MRAAALLFLLLMAPSRVVADTEAPEQPIDEYQVKAAYLAGFAQYVEKSDNAAVVLCTAADRRMLEALQRVAAAKSPPLQVRSVERADTAHGCNVLFIAPPKMKLLRHVIDTSFQAGVLLVGDGPGFLAAGGALEFVWAGNKIQFNANLRAVHRSGLRISSRLLSLARNLRGPAQ